MTRQEATMNSTSVPWTGRSPLIVVESLLITSTVTLSLLLLVVILSREHLRHRPFNQLLVSLSIGAIIFNLFVRPGTILDENETDIMNKVYCVIYTSLLRVEGVLLPYTYWMISIERLIALQEPGTYSKKMNRRARAAMIGVPWVLAVVLTIALDLILTDGDTTSDSTYPNDPDYYYLIHSQLLHIQCKQRYSSQNWYSFTMTWSVFGRWIPLLGLIMGTSMLLVVYCKHRARNAHITSNLTVNAAFHTRSQVHRAVTNGRIGICLFLNTAAILLLINTIVDVHIQMSTNPYIFYTQWAHSVSEIVTAICALTVLPDIRRALVLMCISCCHCPDNEHELLIVSREVEMEDRQKEDK